MKKMFLVFCFLTAAGICVFAGGKSESQMAGQTVTLQVWGGVPAEYGPQASVEEFNKLFKDKGIQAEYTRFVNDTNGNIRLDTTLLSGDSIDLYMSYSTNTLVKRIEGNMALDLTDRIKGDTSFDAKGFGDTLNDYAYNDRYYSLPTKVNLEGIMVNKNMFDAAGIPIPKQWTISEFREIAKKLTKGSGENKIYGAFLNPLPTILYPVQTSAEYIYGGDWMYGQGGKTSNFDSPAIKNIVQNMYNMMNVDKSAPSYVDMVTQKLTLEGMFLGEKSAMAYGSWSIRSVKDAKNYPHDFVTAFVPYPVPDNQTPRYSPGVSGDMLCINPKSKNIDAAWEYMKWYATKGMIPMATGGRIPVYTGYDTEAVKAAFMQGAENLLDAATTSVVVAPRENYSVPRTTFKSPELAQIYIEEIEAILNGVKMVDQGLADAKSRADRILKE
jgi:multiple sugar transport system substrate-binding protein